MKCNRNLLEIYVMRYITGNVTGNRIGNTTEIH